MVKLIDDEITQLGFVLWRTVPHTGGLGRVIIRQEWDMSRGNNHTRRISYGGDGVGRFVFDFKILDA